MARLAVVALAIDLWLLGVQAFALQNFCLFCCFTYLCTFGHLAMNWMMLPVGSRDWRVFLKSERKVQLPSFVWAVSVVVLVTASISLYQYVSSSLSAVRTAGIEQSKKAFLETWSQRPSVTIPVKGTDPVWGNPQSKVQIVVFSDFECPHCQRAAFALHTALAPEQSRIQIIFKHFPLDMSCNPLLKAPIHQNACALAHLGYCANQKNRFWDFHDRVFFKLSARELSSSRDKVYEGVKLLFTRKEFDECLTNPEALANTRDDIEQGKNLGIESTPALFINGKRVAFAPTVDLLRELVQKELALQK